MISPLQFINDLSSLGSAFRSAGDSNIAGNQYSDPGNEIFREAIDDANQQNPWFITDFVRFAFSAWANALQKDKIEKWVATYYKDKDFPARQANVGLIMAGNIPMVGLHDLLCVLASGNKALIKLSSTDKVLIPAILEVLCGINPVYRNHYKFIEGPLKDFDAIIATGSNNSSRYFEYYFGKYPHIIRKNRNGVAVITGTETEDELVKLGDDIFMYFGLGCRNVSKLYIPEGYKVETLYPFMNGYDYLADNHKYRNNYDYQKALLLINRIPHFDNGFLLIKPEQALISPISVLHVETYHNLDSLKVELHDKKDQIQCVICINDDLTLAVPPGRSQFPELWDYADGVDTLNFLMNIGISK